MRADWRSGECDSRPSEIPLWSENSSHQSVALKRKSRGGVRLRHVTLNHNTHGESSEATADSCVHRKCGHDEFTTGRGLFALHNVTTVKQSENAILPLCLMALVSGPQFLPFDRQSSHFFFLRTRSQTQPALPFWMQVLVQGWIFSRGWQCSEFFFSLLLEKIKFIIDQRDKTAAAWQTSHTVRGQSHLEDQKMAPHCFTVLKFDHHMDTTSTAATRGFSLSLVPDRSNFDGFQRL